MLKKLSFEKVELLLASALVPVLISLIQDLPYVGPCVFFFGEPEYPTDEQ